MHQSNMEMDPAAKKFVKSFKKHKPFKTPVNYFEAFAHKLQLEICSNEEKVSWFDRLAYNLQLRFTLPAFLVFGLAFYVAWESIYNLPEPSVSDEMLVSYLSEEQSLFNELDEQIIQQVDLNPKADLIHQEVLMDYLEDEGYIEELIEMEI
jgi:hypothetical protein